MELVDRLISLKGKRITATAKVGVKGTGILDDIGQNAGTITIQKDDGKTLTIKFMAIETIEEI